MGDFPKQGGVAKQTPKAPIKSDRPSDVQPGNTGGVAWGGPGKAVGNNDKHRPR